MSKKNLDGNGRWRNRTVAFRVSDKEYEEIETLVKLSGLNKREYLYLRSMERNVVVHPSPRVHKALKSEMEKILAELQRIGSGEAADAELLKTIQIVAEIFGALEG